MSDLQMAPFWANRLAWPYDQDGFLFLGRAVDLLGRAMFPDAWTGNEFGFDPRFREPVHMPATGREVQTISHAAIIHGILSDAGRDLPRAWPVHHPFNQAHGPQERVKAMGFFWPTVADVGAAHAIVAQRRKAHRLLVAELGERRDAVVAAICHAAVTSRLRTSWQSPRDGSLTPITSSRWNLPSRWAYFTACSLNPADPAKPFIPDSACYIFVGEVALRSMCADAAPAPDTRPEWWPSKTITLAKWCRSAAAEAGAKARLARNGNDDPFETDICKELLLMWNQAGRESGTWRSIQTTRNRS